MSEYSEIENLSWQNILLEKPTDYQPPITVHMPIQPTGSPDFVHVDSALNVCRRRVFPGLSVREWDKYQDAAKKEAFIIQFALDEPAFIPDFHNTRFTTSSQTYPIVQGTYCAYDMIYELEYMVWPIGETSQNVLIVRGTVTNESSCPQHAVVRVKTNFQRECDLFQYHYVPFYWDRDNWLPCDRTGLESGEITLDGSVVGRLIDCGMDIEWEKAAQFDDSDSNKKFSCEFPYYVHPPFRLKNVENVIKLSRHLQPSEKTSFSLAMFVDYENVDEYQLNLIRRLSLESAKRDVLYHFKSQFPKPSAKLVFPTENWDTMFQAMQTSTLQLMVQFPNQTSLMPTQGGSSERHLVWVWEAVCMLMPMLQLGHFKPVKKAIEYIFSLQDGGYPPEGKFTSLEGAVGTTGPRWANSTGSALAIAADYYRYSKDSGFLDEYLPRMLRAAEWIVREIRATRVLDAEGNKPATYGLMPYACSSDGDVGYILAFTDAYSYWGLNKFAMLLEECGHSRASEFRTEADAYKNDIAEAAKSVTYDNGFIDRRIPELAEEKLQLKFACTDGAMHLAYTGCIDVESDIFKKYVEFFENNMADGLFLGPMDREIAYMGIGEWVWQDIYLRMGAWKKAFVAARQNFLYGMTRDTYQVQERFSKFNPAFTPWQPNGSGNGKVLDTIIRSIYYEKCDRVILLGGVPYQYLVNNGITELSNLRTSYGLISIHIEAQKDGCFMLSIKSSNILPDQIQFADHFLVEAIQDAKMIKAGLFSTEKSDFCGFVISEAT